MKRVIAVIEADLRVTPIGTHSRLADDLCGRSVLRRTVERLRRATQVQKAFVLFPQAQANEGRSLLSGAGVEVLPHDGGPPPWRALVQASRKWSLDGWRGGIGGTTHFDEFTDCRLLAGLLDVQAADAVLSVPAGAVLIDPSLADAMIRHWEHDENESRLAFVQAPPGLAGILLDARLIRELAEHQTPVGRLFSFKPDNPCKDLIFESCCVPTPVEVRHAGGRLIADTQRSFDRLAKLLADHAEPDAVQCGRWLTGHAARFAEATPREIELELTTDDPFPHALLRPRGEKVGSRGPMALDLIKKIAVEAQAVDDTLVTLGGFGDPLRHPEFLQVLELLRPREGSATRNDANQRDEPASPSTVAAGVYGLAIRTAAVDLTDAVIEALIRHRVDVLCVALDAWSPELYARLRVHPNPQVPHRLEAGATRVLECAPNLGCIPVTPYSTSDTGRPRTNLKFQISNCAQGDLNHVIAAMDRLARARESHGSVYPLVVPEFIKAKENVHELDEFHDGWLRRLGAVCIGGYSHAARQLEDRSVINMAPPVRAACRRLNTRCLMLADGRVTTCNQDFLGRQAFADLTPRDPGAPHQEVPYIGTLREAWSGAKIEALREDHRQGRTHTAPLCSTCDEWHRP